MFLKEKSCFDPESLYYLSISAGVKITSQGFLFLDSPVRMPSPSYPCPRILGGLCSHGNYTFLPCTSEPLTTVTDAPPPFDRFWRNEAGCGKLPSLSQFHIVPCDLSRGTSIVWSSNSVAVQYDMDMDYWSNLFSMLIVLWLIVNLGETIALILEVEGSTAHNHNTAVLCVALVSIVAANTPESLWVTENDLLLYRLVVGYIVAYSFYHLSNPNTVNVIIGCLILISARFYQTNETPYVPTFLFLISARLIQKLLLKKWDPVRVAFMAADAVLFYMLYSYSFVPSNLARAQLYLLGILFPAACMGAFVASV